MFACRSRFVSALLGSASILAVMSFQPAVAADAETNRRLESLERRLEQLEKDNQDLKAQNKKLEEDLEWRTQRLEAVENRAGTIVKPDVAPTLGDPNGNFSFKVRGVFDAEWANFNSRAGGYAFNNGTEFRRARVGAEGVAFKDFAWRIEPDFAGNVVTIQDAYVAYQGVPHWIFTAGQHKVAYGLESNTSDNYNTFLERGMASNAFGTVGAERRLGVSVQWADGPYTAQASLSGDSEASSRADTAPNESWGINGRFTWEPINDADYGHVLHLGAASYLRTELKQTNGAVVTKNAIRFSDRPNIRVDGGLLADTGVITDVKDVFYLGAEAVGIYGPFSLQGEYSRGQLNRMLPALNDVTLSGGYVYASWFLTGEYRAFRGGTIDRLRPRANFNPQRGNWGALELAFRYDTFDFGDTPVAARAGNKGHSTTTAVNWYLNPNIKLLFNWVRFTGTNTPLDPVGNTTKGDAFAERLHIDW